MYFCLIVCNPTINLTSKGRMKYQDDSFYIEQILQGNSSAYSFLVAKHKNLVFSIALKILNNREDAEEVAQDAFVKAYRSIAGFEGKSKFSTWLYRIVYNSAISKTRKRKLEFVPMDNYLILNHTDADDVAPYKDGDTEEQMTILRDALKTLTEDESLLISLFYHGEKSVEEISYITGLSESNVKVRLHRIRKKLHERMKSKILT